MTEPQAYEPGPANLARVLKDGEKWTLILVRELRHSPEKVWQALTDPAQLREWAPFVTDGSLGAVGTVKLTWVGAPMPIETKVTRVEAPKALEYGDMRWELEASGKGTRLTLWAKIDRRFISMGRCWLAHFFRCLGSPAQRNSHRTHRWRRCHEVRRLAAAECGIRPAVRRESA